MYSKNFLLSTRIRGLLTNNENQITSSPSDFAVSHQFTVDAMLIHNICDHMLSIFIRLTLPTE